MKKQNKEMIVYIPVMTASLIMLLFGVFWKEIGQEGKAIFMIMCSLYSAMLTHAVILSSRINAKFQDKR